jgi:hypothetical protein
MLNSQLLGNGNATIRIEYLTTSQDASGGTVETYTTLAAGVPVLATQTSGNRDGRFDGTNNIITGTVTGENVYLARADIRIYFETANPKIEFLAGLYAYPQGVSPHAGSPCSWIPKRYTVVWSNMRVT